MLTFLTIPELKQGSHEWLDWQQTVIDASDAPTIMGENPFKSKEYLALEKLGEKKPVFRGNTANTLKQSLKLLARTSLSQRLGKQFSPAVAQSRNTPWLSASMDAIDVPLSTVAEIKCDQQSHEYTVRTGKAPPYHYGQLQHILLVTGFQWVVYYSFRPRMPEQLLYVPRDERYINKLSEEISNFLNELRFRGYKPRETLYYNI